MEEVQSDWVRTVQWDLQWLKQQGGDADPELARLLGTPARSEPGDAAGLMAAVDPRVKMLKPVCPRLKRKIDDLRREMSRNRAVREQNSQRISHAQEETRRLGELFQQSPEADKAVANVTPLDNHRQSPGIVRDGHFGCRC